MSEKAGSSKTDQIREPIIDNLPNIDSNCGAGGCKRLNGIDGSADNDNQSMAINGDNPQHSSEKARSETEEFKNLIRKHELFPLLKYLKEKCQMATVNPENESHTKIDSDQVLTTLNLKSLSKNYSSGNDELDNLMLTTIYVLRVNLLELEKVNELGKDFCTRYITCLKGRLSQETLLGWADIDEDIYESPPATSPPTDDADVRNGSTVVATLQTPNGQVSIPLFMPLLMPPFMDANNGVNNNETGMAADLRRRNSTLLRLKAGGGVSQGSRADALGNTPTTFIGSSTKSELSVLSETSSLDSGQSLTKGKRVSLPKRAVETLRKWLFDHVTHPYPSEEVKRELCRQCDLNLRQVNDWFINARRRILQPMLDAAGEMQNVLAERLKEICSNGQNGNGYHVSTNAIPDDVAGSSGVAKLFNKRQESMESTLSQVFPVASDETPADRPGCSKWTQSHVEVVKQVQLVKSFNKTQESFECKLDSVPRQTADEDPDDRPGCSKWTQPHLPSVNKVQLLSANLSPVQKRARIVSGGP